jgi:nitrite reductase/ring-hydroxylating ferredoxin subunit
MQNEFRPVLKTTEIAPGGMKAVELEGNELVVCNCDGTFYALARRCGHMNAPLERGTLDGVILTCAMHCAQFDVTTGEALAGPVPHDFGGEVPPAQIGTYLQNIAALMQPVRTESIRTYPTKIIADDVCIALQKK